MPARASTSSSAAKASMTFRELLRALEARRPLRRRSPGCRTATATASSTTPIAPVAPLDDGDAAAAEPRRARARRLHAARPAGRRRRDLARLHVRLQLLLDHRDARPQLPHAIRFERVLADIARRAARTARARSSSSTTTSRSTSARFEALCQAIIDAGLQRHRLHRAGDDVADRRSTARRWRR